MNRAVRAPGLLAVACAATALTAALCGCFVVGERYVFQRQFTDEQVRTIRNGETTRKEVLDRFGPPSAVARPGDAATDNVFHRFAATGGAAAGRVAYCYAESALQWIDLCAYGQSGGGCIPSTPVRKSRTLWILIDGTTGRVVDHALEETVREEKGLPIQPWLGPAG